MRSSERESLCTWIGKTPLKTLQYACKASCWWCDFVMTDLRITSRVSAQTQNTHSAIVIVVLLLVTHMCKVGRDVAVFTAYFQFTR